LGLTANYHQYPYYTGRVM